MSWKRFLGADARGRKGLADVVVRRAVETGDLAAVVVRHTR